jgi:hypothetical protein
LRECQDRAVASGVVVIVSGMPGRGSPVLEVHCQCPAEMAARRYAERAARRSRHHGAHPISALPESRWSEFDRPMALGPVSTVDTTSPVDVSILADHIRSKYMPGGVQRHQP